MPSLSLCTIVRPLYLGSRSIASLHGRVARFSTLNTTTAFYRFKGNFAAPLTAYTANDEIDTSQVDAYAKLLADEKISGVFLNATSAESISLTMAERKVIAEAWLATDEAKSGTLDVIVHIGGNALPEVLELGHHAVASGAKGIAMFPPTYYRPESVDHLVDLVVQVAREFPKTPFLYRTPEG